MRQNEESYFDFYEFLLVPMVGKPHFWDILRRDGTPPRNAELATINDEAFALLTYENYYERWKDIAVNNDYQLPQRMRRCWNNTERSKVSEVKAKYTTGGIFTGTYSKSSVSLPTLMYY